MYSNILIEAIKIKEVIQSCFLRHSNKNLKDILFRIKSPTTSLIKVNYYLNLFFPYPFNSTKKKLDK